MENKATMKTRINSRERDENFFEGQHMSITDLKENAQVQETHMYKKYLGKCIPDYPTPVEFHITEVAHVTNKTSIPEIWNSGGFRASGTYELSWWSMKVNEADITAAEERYLEKRFPERSEDERAAQKPFLSQFTTSPAFKETSRYGNFRFTFPVTELMETYRKQHCDGQEPVLRVYETKLFKQEIEYVVLVHSPQFNEHFKMFPQLSSSPFVDYDGQQIIWRAQAVCETHYLQLGKKAEVYSMNSEFYVWDQISFAFHTRELLTFPKGKLNANLSCCDLDPNVNLSRGENCSSLKEAEKILESLHDDEPEKEDVKEELESAKIKMEMD